MPTVITIEDDDGFKTEHLWPDDATMLGNADFADVAVQLHIKARQKEQPPRSLDDAISEINSLNERLEEANDRITLLLSERNRLRSIIERSLDLLAEGEYPTNDSEDIQEPT